MQARFEYGGLILTCDEEDFARLRTLVCADLSVAEATVESTEPPSVRFISIRPPSDDAPVAYGWLSVIAIVIGILLSGVPLIVGWVTIVRWFLR